MNEEELKKLWQKDQTAPQIDFARLQKLSADWHKKLRRKLRIDVWAQGITTVACLMPVFYYPKMIFASVLVFILGVWYVRELRGLYKIGKFEVDSISVSQSVKAQIETLKKFFWRTRIAVYVLMPLILIAAYYGLGTFDKPEVIFTHWLIRLTKILIVAEVPTVILCEIYFKILYKPALKELKNLLRQLDSNE